MTTLKTFSLFAALALVAALVGFIVAGGVGVVLGALMVMFVAGASMGASERMVMRLQGAVPVSRWQAPELYARVATLAARAGVPMPALYVSASPAANAMTLQTRADRGALAVTRGALRLLGYHEMNAVLAHEIAHLKNGDTRMLQLTMLMSRAALTMLRVGTWIAVFGVLMTGGGVARAALLALLAVIVPVIIHALQSALSRTRELAADAEAAALTGQPLALASALAKLDHYHEGWLHRLMPSQGPEWLHSHPPTEERVRRLMAMAGR